MSSIYINLPVKDLERSKQFFTSLGYSINPVFTDEKAACIVIEEGSIYAMLLREEFFKTFTKKEICNAHTHTEVLLAIEADSKEGVDSLVQKAVDAGGTVYSEPQDHDWMYQHAFADPDGHQWEVLWSDMSQLPAEMRENREAETRN